jgi:hypothetical protein
MQALIILPMLYVIGLQKITKENEIVPIPSGSHFVRFAKAHNYMNVSFSEPNEVRSRRDSDRPDCMKQFGKKYKGTPHAPETVCRWKTQTNAIPVDIVNMEVEVEVEASKQNIDDNFVNYDECE